MNGQFVMDGRPMVVSEDGHIFDPLPIAERALRSRRDALGLSVIEIEALALAALQWAPPTITVEGTGEREP